MYYRLVTSWAYVLVLHNNCVCAICRNTLLKGIHSFIHLNLAIALLLALIVFVSGIRATDSEVSQHKSPLANIVMYYLHRLVVQ